MAAKIDATKIEQAIALIEGKKADLDAAMAEAKIVNDKVDRLTGEYMRLREQFRMIINKYL